MKQSADLCVDSFNPDKDRLGLASFAGNLALQVEDATLDSALTTDFSGVKDRISVLLAHGDSSVAASIRQTQAELFGPRGRDTAHKLAVLVVDGPADTVNPGGDSTSYTTAVTAAMIAASAAATDLKAAGATLVVVGYDIPAAFTDQYKSIASPGYYFDVISPEELEQVLSNLAHLFCLFDGSYYYYYYSVPPDGHFSPQLDYKHFINWDVIDGVVDLCGKGTNGLALFDLLPGNGLYVDLVGTNPENATGNHVYEGTMQTKVTFALQAGKTYKLSLKLGGNQRQGIPGFRTHVMVGDFSHTGEGIPVGDLLDKWVQIDDWQQPFVVYSWTFTPAHDESASIRIQMGSGPSPRWSTVGTYMDDVKLENITDSATIFSDNFDNENPV